jgi:hypothetical protein
MIILLPCEGEMPKAEGIDYIKLAILNKAKFTQLAENPVNITTPFRANARNPLNITTVILS